MEKSPPFGSVAGWVRVGFGSGSGRGRVGVGTGSGFGSGSMSGRGLVFGRDLLGYDMGKDWAP